MAKRKAEGGDVRPARRLLWMSVSGGFLDGTRIEFSPRLNCIIGGRGAGKTTVIEFIRYALDAMPKDPEACERIKSLVECNLDFGRIEVGIETKEGFRHVITRVSGEPPAVYAEDRKGAPLAIKPGGLFHAAIYSQNEVESTADRPTSQLELIDNFELEPIADINGQLKRVGVELSSGAGVIGPLQEKIAALHEEIDALPALEARLACLAGGGPDAEAVNRAYRQKSLRDGERRAVDGLVRALTDHCRTIGESVGLFDREARRLFGADAPSGPNKKLVEGVLLNLRECSRDVDALVRRAQERIAQEKERLSADAEELTALHADQEEAFRSFIGKHEVALAQAAERTRLEGLRNDLKAKQRELEEAEVALAKHTAHREAVLSKLGELRERRYRTRTAVIERINRALAPNIRVGLVQDGNLDRYSEAVEQAFRGNGFKHGSVTRKIVEAMWPADLAALVRKRDVDGLARKAGLSVEQAEKAIASIQMSGRLHQLESVELTDHPRIELNDGGACKESQSLSTGQKCTAVLPILLLESDKPLLVDQPEDNLDNRFITETLVKGLQSAKVQRQVVLVTHNPNIPVLGDAERVIVMESDGRSARPSKCGTVDECKSQIIELLEGGVEAFRRRRERYRCCP